MKHRVKIKFLVPPYTLRGMVSLNWFKWNWAISANPCEHSSPLSTALGTMHSKANRLCFVSLRTSWCSGNSSSSAQRSKSICKELWYVWQLCYPNDSSAHKEDKVMSTAWNGQGEGNNGVWTGS